jgi:hypothetical protein
MDSNNDYQMTYTYKEEDLQQPELGLLPNPTQVIREVMQTQGDAPHSRMHGNGMSLEDWLQVDNVLETREMLHLGGTSDLPLSRDTYFMSVRFSQDDSNSHHHNMISAHCSPPTPCTAYPSPQITPTAIVPKAKFHRFVS